MSFALLVAVSTLFLASPSLPNPDAFSCFVLFANQYLEKSGTKVFKNISSTSNCLRQCLTIGREESDTFVCRSVMWKKNSNDCILSRWSLSQRPKHLKISQKMDVDLYENSCLNSDTSSTVYLTSEQTMARTTTLPDTKGETTTPLPSTSSHQIENSIDFKRFRVFHAKSIIGAPLPQQALHRIDGESSLPPLAKLKHFLPEKKIRVANDDQVFQVSAQLDDTTWSHPIGTRPIRKGKIVPHIAPPSTTESATTELPTSPFPARVYSTVLSTTTVPFSFVTPSRPSPCFGRVKDHYLPNFEEKTLQGATVRQCLLSCLNASTFFCASVNYQEVEKKCTLNGGNVKLNKVRTVEKIGSDYFENKCHLGDRDDQLEEVVANILIKNRERVPNCFEERKNYVLSSLDAIVIRHLNDLNECTSACSTGPISCSALNWIPSTNGCMLFHGEIDTSQLIESADSSFYTNKCSKKLTKKKTEKRKDDEYYDQE